MPYYPRYKYQNKPKGMYKAHSLSYACASCAYREHPNKCRLHKTEIKSPCTQRCADFMNEESGLPET